MPTTKLRNIPPKRAEKLRSALRKVVMPLSTDQNPYTEQTSEVSVAKDRHTSWPAQLNTSSTHFIHFIHSKGNTV